MARSTVFKINRSQAVRLPKEVALPEAIKKVEILKIGTSRLISPEGESWDSWFEGPNVSEDFMRDRDQPEDQERSGF